MSNLKGVSDTAGRKMALKGVADPTQHEFIVRQETGLLANLAEDNRVA
jgi:hypothetical protein